MEGTGRPVGEVTPEQRHQQAMHAIVDEKFSGVWWDKGPDPDYGIAREHVKMPGAPDTEELIRQRRAALKEDGRG